MTIQISSVLAICKELSGLKFGPMNSEFDDLTLPGKNEVRPSMTCRCHLSRKLMFSGNCMVKLFYCSTVESAMFSNFQFQVW